jgi:hypothetical protein
MARSKVFDDILKSLTPEKREEIKQERISYVKSLTSEFQLGLYVGEHIVNRHLPTLSTDGIRTRNVIQVSEEDVTENKRLDKDWFSTTRYGENNNGSENGDKEKWNSYYQHNKMLEKKYLPNPLICYVGTLNIQDMDEFKKGLIQTLWDCDTCSYNLEKDNIKIYNDEGYYSTIIEFKLDEDKLTLK